MESNQKNTGIKTLRVIAKISLAGGILMGILIPVVYISNPYNSNVMPEFEGFILGFVCWALFLVLCSIAESLIFINEKMTKNP